MTTERLPDDRAAPAPGELQHYIELLLKDAPAGYEPWLFRCAKEGKAPATEFGSWKDEKNRLTPDEAVEAMQDGYNIGIAGMENDLLVNVDIDDDDATDPEAMKDTLMGRSRSRSGRHAWYFAEEGEDIPNIPTDDKGEVRSQGQYVLAPGSYVPTDTDDVPEGQEDYAGYYTVEKEREPATLMVEELPEVFLTQLNQSQAQKRIQDTVEDTESDPPDIDGKSAVFDVSAKDVVTKEGASTDPSDRWGSAFHGSTTGQNMSLSQKGRIQCWRHNVAHGGLQALVALSDHPGTCEAVGTGHKGSNAGPSSIKSDDSAIWHAWKYAKKNGYVPEDDPVPYRALKHLCRERELCPVSEIPEKYDPENGQRLPDYAYNGAIESIENKDGLKTGRELTDDIDGGKEDEEDGHEFGLYDSHPALEAAKEQLRGVLTAIESDDDEEPSEGQIKSLLTIAAKLPEEDYADYKDRIVDVADLTTDRLDAHREYFQHREEYGRIRVHDGQTWYLMESETGLYEAPVLNFEIDVKSILNIQGDQEVEAVLDKQHGGTVKTQFAPKVLKRKQRFKDDVLGSSFGLNYDPPYRHGEKVLNSLNEYIGLLDVPERQGTHHIGLHGDEWVTPKGTLREDGWVDEPETVYSKRNVALERVIDLPQPAEFEKEDVQTILRNVAKTRDTDRILPVLAWFYAVPFRPYIDKKWNASGLNHLNITGDTGSGKTTTLKYLWRLFGATANADPFDVTDTNFAMITQMATSNGFPVWYDEFKPSDIQDYKLEKFRDYYRKAATGGVVTRGKADQTTEEYHLRAPIVLSGEEQIRQPAERRRSIMVSFRESVTNKGTDTRRAFKELVGEGRIEDGELVLPKDVPDPANHAIAYYKWVAGADEDWLRAKWEDAREMVWQIRQEWEEEMDLGDMEIQSMQLVGFGWMVMREFARSMDVATDELPDAEALNHALRHVVGEIGPEGKRKGHMDEFVELFVRAVATDYVEEGVHYTIVHEGKPGQEELRIHVSRAYDALSRYVQNHDLTSVDLLSNAEDYKKRIREAAEADGGYVVTSGQYTPRVGGRCAGFSTSVAMNELEFDRATFGLSSFEDGSGNGDGGDGYDEVPLARAPDAESNYVTVTAEVQTVEPFGDQSGVKAVLQDRTGIMDMMTYYHDEWMDKLDAVEGEAVVAKDVRVTYDSYNDATVLEPVTNVTQFEKIQHGVGYTEGDTPDNQTELDESSGVPDDATGPLANAQRLKAELMENGPMQKSDAAAALVVNGPLSQNDFEPAIDKARKKGWIEENGDTIEAL